MCILYCLVLLNSVLFQPCLFQPTNVFTWPSLPEYVIKTGRGIPNGFRLFDRVGVWSLFVFGNQSKTINQK